MAYATTAQSRCFAARAATGLSCRRDIFSLPHSARGVVVQLNSVKLIKSPDEETNYEIQ